MLVYNPGDLAHVDSLGLPALCHQLGLPPDGTLPPPGARVPDSLAFLSPWQKSELLSGIQLATAVFYR